MTILAIIGFLVLIVPPVLGLIGLAYLGWLAYKILGGKLW